MVGGGGLGALATLYPMVGFSLPHYKGEQARAHHPPCVHRGEKI